MNLTKLSTSPNTKATLLVLTDSAEAQETLKESLPLLEGRFTVSHAHPGGIPTSNLHSYGETLRATIDHISMKRATLVAFNGACSLAMVMLGKDSYRVRHTIFVDPPGHPGPASFTEFGRNSIGASGSHSRFNSIEIPLTSAT